MSLSTDLQTFFAPLAPGGAHHIVASSPPGQPYISWMVVGGAENVHLGGRPALQNRRVQVDIWAPRQTELEAVYATLMAAVDAGLQPGASGLRLIPLSTYSDMLEEAVLLRRRMIEFSVWAQD